MPNSPVERATTVQLSVPLKSPWSERTDVAYAACAAVAAMFVCLAIRDAMHRNAAQRDAFDNALRSKLTRVTADKILHGRSEYYGVTAAPFTLVEFGDYECPPCRANQGPLATLLSRHKAQLKLDFRQFPLKQLHPHAESAALAAVAASGTGKFWRLHSDLFTANVSSPGAVSKCLSAVGVASDNRAARVRLSADIALAHEIGIRGTPTFVLCFPEGMTFRMDSLNDVDSTLTRYMDISARAKLIGSLPASTDRAPPCADAQAPGGCVP